jgi:hypothetical protein
MMKATSVLCPHMPGDILVSWGVGVGLADGQEEGGGGLRPC